MAFCRQTRPRMSQSGIKYAASFLYPFCMCLISARSQGLFHFFLNELNDIPFVKKTEFLQGWALLLLLLLSSEILCLMILSYEILH